MKSSLITILCTLLIASLASALPFQERVRQDVNLFFAVRSLSEIREKLSEHPLTQLFEDEVLIKRIQSTFNFEVGDDEFPGFFEEMEAVFGLDEDAFFELFPGQVSMALYNLSDQFLEEGKDPELVLMAEFAGDAERLEELMQIQFERNAESHKQVNSLVEHEWVKESFMGETLHFDEVFDGEKTYVEDGYALVDGIFVLATPESRLREAVEIIKEGCDESLSESSVYQRSRIYADVGDVTLYLNLTRLIASLNDALAALPVYDKLAFFGVTAESLQNALSLESIQGFCADLDLVENGLLGSYGILYGEKEGLISLLAYNEGELPEARYVPKEVVSSSVSLFDLGAMLAELERLLGVASPTLLPLFDVQLQTIKTNTGVDLRTSILENMDAEIVEFTVLKDDVSDTSGSIQPQQVGLIRLKDAEAFGKTVNALIDNFQIGALIEESVFEGETIYSVQGAESEQAVVNYVITRSHLIICVGHISTLHSVLSKMNSEDEGLWQDAEMEDLFTRIEQPGAVSRFFYDLEQVFDLLLGLMGKVGEFYGSDETSDEVPTSLQEPYRIVCEVNEAPGILFGRALLVKSEATD